MSCCFAREARLLTQITPPGMWRSALLLITAPINIQSFEFSYNFPSLKVMARVAAQDMNVGEEVRRGDDDFMEKVKLGCRFDENESVVKKWDNKAGKLRVRGRGLSLAQELGREKIQESMRSGRSLCMLLIIRKIVTASWVDGALKGLWV